MAKHTLVDIIDSKVKAEHDREPPFRAHLGGSMIGRKCEREIWYGFRHAAHSSFQGRMLRLFNRGHLEEFRFVNYLELAGIEVQAYSEALIYHPESDSYFTEPWGAVAVGEPRDADGDPISHSIERAQCVDVTSSQLHVARAEGMGTRIKQWRISDVMGHFGGSLDGIASAYYEIAANDYDWSNAGPIPVGEQFLVEFKTHNDKSFVKLSREGVAKAKPEHVAQMQIYMHKRNLRWALYMAVNKNDDDLHVEIVMYDEAVALELLAKAERIIRSTVAPPRIGNNASWYDCKWCSYNGICHMGMRLHKSCRSCQYAEAVDDGEWRCNNFGGIIPREFVSQGCDAHKQVTD